MSGSNSLAKRSTTPERFVIQIDEHSELYESLLKSQLADDKVSKSSKDALAKMLEEQRKSQRSLQATLRKLENYDFAAANRIQISGQEAMSSAGWTQAGWMLPRQVAEFSSANSRRIDSFFLAGYSDVKAYRFTQMKRCLLTHNALTPWRATLKECFSAYESGFFRVCIFSLLPIFEGAAIRTLTKGIKGPPRQRITRSTAVIRELSSLKLDDSYDVTVLFWRSLLNFARSLYAHADFSSAPPVVLNRNWVLHGRRGPKGKRLDALRLFHALDTLSFVYQYHLDTKGQRRLSTISAAG